MVGRGEHIFTQCPTSTEKTWQWLILEDFLPCQRPVVVAPQHISRCLVERSTHRKWWQCVIGKPLATTVRNVDFVPSDCLVCLTPNQHETVFEWRAHWEAMKKSQIACRTCTDHLTWSTLGLHLVYTWSTLGLHLSYMLQPWQDYY